MTLTEHFGAASAPIWFDEIVVHRGSINLFLLLVNIQLVVSVLRAQNASDDQRRVARSVHFNLNAIPAYGRGS